MKANFSASLSFTLVQEGGWEDNPEDDGGPTNRGITLRTLQTYQRGATINDLRNISPSLVSAIYQTDYWHVMSCDVLPSGLDLSTFDFGVTSGPRESIEALQRAVGVDDDGLLGPISMAAINKASPPTAIAALAGLQKGYYQSLKDFPVFGDGWLTRTERRTVAAMRLVGAKT